MIPCSHHELLKGPQFDLFARKLFLTEKVKTAQPHLLRTSLKSE